ncbi:MAG: hypothetical protein M1812_001932 [Candelaria pacifica]|nr:MAG: hypothetical protein M1812_001932 [Candelaria pacifica]
MHFFIFLLGALAGTLLEVSAARVEAIQKTGGASNVVWKQEVSWDACTSFQSIWKPKHTTERVDQINFHNSDAYHIIFYHQLDCKGSFGKDEFGYLPQANLYLNNAVSVAITEQGFNDPSTLYQFHFDDGKTPDTSISWLPGANVFHDMQAFKVQKGPCRGSAVVNNEDSLCAAKST